MLTSFFKTSKPIHYIIVFLMVAFAIGYFVFSAPHLGWNFIWIPFSALGSIAVLQFITLKNDLTQSSSYSLWIYSCLIIIGVLYSTDILVFVSYLLSLLALRRLISMRTGRGLVKKIFDASFWIAVATLFYSWSSLFFIVIFLSIVIYAFKNLKYWTIPFIAVSCVSLLTFTFDQLLETQYLFNALTGYRHSVNFETFEVNIPFVVSSIVALLGFLFSLVTLFGIPNISLSARSRFSVLGFTGVCGSIFMIINGIAIFTIPIVAIFLSRLVQETDDKKVKETLLWLPFISMLILFFMRL
jgi:hypothetical protein